MTATAIPTMNSRHFGNAPTTGSVTGPETLTPRIRCGVTGWKVSPPTTALNTSVTMSASPKVTSSWSVSGRS